MMKTIVAFMVLPFFVFGERSPMSLSLFPKIKNHLERLTSNEAFANTDKYAKERELIAKTLKENLSKGNEISVLVVCTGNSRRSMMAAAMGNAAVAFYDLKGVRFYSGGTTPSAFNPRAIRALGEIGFQISPTGEKADPGPKGEENPIYTIKWGEGTKYQGKEYSKKYLDAVKPNGRFIALMVCDEANKECPVVTGAIKRVAIPFEDPKNYDGTSVESSKYAERRDDLAIFMLQMLKQVRS